MNKHCQNTLIFIALLLIAAVTAGQAQTVTYRLCWDAVTTDTSAQTENGPITYWIYGDSLCSTPLQEDHFIAATTDTTYEHQVLSGTNYFYRVLAVDQFGNRSAETEKTGNVPFVLSEMRLFLEGPFNSEADSMQTALRYWQNLPLHSPYLQSNRSVSAHKENTVDWVLVSLYENVNDPPVYNNAFLLAANGWLSESTAENHFIGFADVDTGSYSIQIRHRNHLRIRSTPVQLNKTSKTINFVENHSLYHSLSEVKKIKTNTWVLKAGDLDENNSVNNQDYVNWSNQAINGAGEYATGDLNMDGLVTTLDYTLWWNNRQ